MVDIIHDVSWCGKVAFRYAHSPSPGEIIDHTKAVLLDGTMPTGGTAMICGSCGQGAETADLRPADRPSWN